MDVWKDISVILNDVERITKYLEFQESNDKCDYL